MRVDVCVCTFRRPQIAATLKSIAEQELEAGHNVRVIVADNDIEPTARAIVLNSATEYNFDVRYIHAPGRNISIARNACLDYAEGDWIAFLDDDETASPKWLSELISKTSGADVVFGPVRAVYSSRAPSWLRAADFHSTRVVYRNGCIETGYAGNVLMNRRAVEAANIRFDLHCGVSGGEDTMFFGRLAATGLRFVEAPEALATEPVPEGRASLRWLARRFWRSGQSHAAMILTNVNSTTSPPRAVLSAAKTGVCLAGAATTAFWSAIGWRRWLLRGLLHCGMAARFAGINGLR